MRRTILVLIVAERYLLDQQSFLGTICNQPLPQECCGRWRDTLQVLGVSCGLRRADLRIDRIIVEPLGSSKMIFCEVKAGMASHGTEKGAATREASKGWLSYCAHIVVRFSLASFQFKVFWPQLQNARKIPVHTLQRFIVSAITISYFALSYSSSDRKRSS